MSDVAWTFLVAGYAFFAGAVAAILVLASIWDRSFRSFTGSITVCAMVFALSAVWPVFVSVAVPCLWFDDLERKRRRMR